MDGTDPKCEQIRIDDISVGIGDKIFKGDVLYAEVIDISESLYFLKKPDKPDSLPDIYIKANLVKELLYGSLSLQNLSFR